VARFAEHEFLESSARTASANSDGLRVDGYAMVTIMMSSTAVTGSSPTVNAEPEVSNDNSTWFPMNVYPSASDPAVMTMQLAATGQISMTLPLCAKYLRVKTTIGGSSTPGHTFSVVANFLKQPR